jgi:radical SAM-linked protein
MTRGFRWRTAFLKQGRLRFLSHLEVARALERSVRRADLPYAVTQGFSPHMRVAFGPALPVGAAGDAELFDVWLTDFVPPAEVLRRLRASTPSDLAPQRGRFVEDSAASLSAACTGAAYSVLITDRSHTAPDVLRAMAAAAERAELTVPHKGRLRSYDPRHELLEPPLVTGSGGGVSVRLVMRLGQQGALRPDALVAAALEYSEAETVNLVVTRTGLLEERDGAYRDPLE